MSLDNSIYLAEMVRRLGVKGSEATFPLVPGIVPVMVLGTPTDLVSAPKEAIRFDSWVNTLTGIGVAGFKTTVAAPGTREIQFGSPGEILIQTLVLSSSEPTVKFALSKITTGGRPVGGIPLAQLPVYGGFTTLNPAVHFGVPFCVGSYALNGLRWYLSSGEMLAVAVSQNPNVPYDLRVSCIWKELPAPSIEP